MTDFSYPPRKPCVLVIDGDVSVSEMLGGVLDREGFSMADEAASGQQGLDQAKKFRPDMAIVALDLPDMGGHTLISAIRALKPDLRVLVYTGTKIPGLIAAALEAKPQGFVHKTEPLALLCQAINMVAQGIHFFSPYAGRFSASKQPALSSKERSVLGLVAEGMSSKEVAGRLNLSLKTVEYHRTQMMQKLGVTNVVYLTRQALRLGLLSLE